MPKNISKRSALRFDGFKRPIRYKTEFDDGQARLLNISTAGCAIDQATVELLEREKVLLTITFNDPGDEVEVQAIVVRAEGETAGLQFQRVSEVNKHRILHFFAGKVREQKGGATAPF